MTIDSLLNNRILANGRVIHYYVVTLEQPMLIYNIHDIRSKVSVMFCSNPIFVSFFLFWARMFVLIFTLITACSKFALRMVVILVLVVSTATSKWAFLFEQATIHFVLIWKAAPSINIQLLISSMAALAHLAI